MKTLVSLTYDGGQLCHLETALPHLDRCGLKGTFYCEPVMLLESLPEWAAVLGAGHEIGNGTLHGAVLKDGTLPGWTPEMVREDVQEAKSLIDDLFPEQTEHSFAFPWGRPLSDGVDVSPIVQGIYATVRTGEHGTNAPPIDPARLKCIRCHGLSADALIDQADRVHESGGWIVFSFDGVGSGERGIDTDVHRALCQWLCNDQRFKALTVAAASSRLRQSAGRTASLV